MLEGFFEGEFVEDARDDSAGTAVAGELVL
jgi:hypothetical protein